MHSYCSVAYSRGRSKWVSQVSINQSGKSGHGSLTIHGIGNCHVIEVIFLFKTLLKHSSV